MPRQGTLPANLPYPPTYAKVNPADAPILTLALTSDTLPIDKVSDAADTLLQPKLSEIAGVGRSPCRATCVPAVRVRVDPARLAAYGLSMEDVRTAVAAANANGAKGGFDGPRLAFALGANDQLMNADAYKTLIIAWRNNAPVRLSAVGSVVGSVENDRVAARYDGKQAVVLDIQRQPGANIVQTVDAIKQALPKLQAAIPAGIKLNIVTDRTQTIRASVRDVQYTLIMSVVLVVLVIFLFLRSARATFIPAIALPLSLIGTFGVMAELGYGLDNLSLMALTIATGFVVDDAIVMIENVVRYIEQGVPPLEAAFRGAKQIGFTIVSLTVSLIAVFIPLLFMTGVVGRLFKEFSVTLAVAVVVSAVVSLTLTPMLCGRLLRPAIEEHPGAVARFSEAVFDRLLGAYRRSLAWTFRHERLDAAGRGGDAGRHDRAVHRRAEGFPAAAGHRRDHRGDDAGGAERLHPASARSADPDGGQTAARSGGDRRRFLRRRRHDQRHAEYRSLDHRAEADRPARRRCRRSSPACSGRSPASPASSAWFQPVQDITDRHPGQPHAIPVHADGHRRGGTRHLGAEAARATGADARPDRRHQRPAGRRLAHHGRGGSRRRRAAWCDRCRRCRTRCTTRSASGRSPPSSARPTSTG